MYYNLILKFYIKPHMHNSIKINTINSKNSDYLKKIEGTYFDAGFENHF